MHLQYIHVDIQRSKNAKMFFASPLSHPPLSPPLFPLFSSPPHHPLSHPCPPFLCFVRQQKFEAGNANVYTVLALLAREKFIPLQFKYFT
jgi:hypothetical protein